ncbi:hypothetical protein [Nocardia huaxiensis]|uniref:Uncharacterized protein n=1 Tax=Nocardia huaxiensis TaxID=2755382 RepID=A0A7D7A1V8_9NOCA|nr:hypothetical protein [Nocardia huaxiensis]QLY33909.1 hypothetical protein H0264_18235 [Nocardia huaxiensis]UFS99156.1 hypothetical protein LPY97_15280 [Nocardia huaxiensis]
MQNPDPSAPAGTLIVNADGSDAVIVRELDCAMLTIASIAVLSIALALMVLISNADFGDGQQPTPGPAGNCQPFCPVTGG